MSGICLIPREALASVVGWDLLFQKVISGACMLSTHKMLMWRRRRRALMEWKNSPRYKHKPCMLQCLSWTDEIILLDSSFMDSASEICICFDSHHLCWVLCKEPISCVSIKTAVIICHCGVNWFTLATKALVPGLTISGITGTSVAVELNYDLLPYWWNWAIKLSGCPIQNSWHISI